MLETHVQQMKALAKQLVNKSFPIVPPEEEEKLSCLKQREVTIDGYNVVLYFNCCKYGEINLETLQIFGKYFVFLPFSLICKIAAKFLGNKELSFIEVIHNKERKNEIGLGSRKIYVWTVYYDERSQPIPNPFIEEKRVCSYEGLNYSRIDRNQVTFF